MSGEPHVRIDRGRLARQPSMARQNTHRQGNDAGLSLPDLTMPARPAAYLARIGACRARLFRGAQALLRRPTGRKVVGRWLLRSSQTARIDWAKKWILVPPRLPWLRARLAIGSCTLPK